MRNFFTAFIDSCKQLHKPFMPLLNNWTWKLAALGVALIIFFSIRGLVSHTQSLTLTVEASTVEDGQALVGFDPEVIRVTFRGSENEIRQLSMANAEAPKVALKLRQPPPGTSSVDIRLSSRDILRDGDLRVASIEPSTVTALFDTSDTRTFAVNEPIISGSPATGMVMVTIEPRTVQLTGSRLLMDELEAAEHVLATAILDVSNRTEGFQTNLKVLPPDNRGGWTLSPDTVRADVKFVREDKEKTFTKVPVRVLQSFSGARYRPEPRTAEVKVQGADQELDAISQAMVQILIEEPEQVAPDEEGRLICEPVVVLPCTNRVSRVTVSPTQIWLKPIELPTEEKDVQP